MSHSFVSQYVHYVFSTKHREHLLTPELQERLFPYMGGIATQNKMKPIAIGGVSNHIHLLLALPATLPIAKAIQLIKGGSSKWIHDTFAHTHYVSWQQGYGAFSVSVSHVAETVRYIGKQAEHHRHVTYEEEFLQFLHKHNIVYDEQEVFG